MLSECNYWWNSSASVKSSSGDKNKSSKNRCVSFKKRAPSSTQPLRTNLFNSSLLNQQLLYHKQCKLFHNSQLLLNRKTSLSLKKRRMTILACMKTWWMMNLSLFQKKMMWYRCPLAYLHSTEELVCFTLLLIILRLRQCNKWLELPKCLLQQSDLSKLW